MIRGTGIGECAYNFYYKKALNAGTYCIHFKNTAFEGVIHIKANGKDSTFVAPEMDGESVCG